MWTDDLLGGTRRNARVSFIGDPEVVSTGLITAHEFGHILLGPNPHREGPEDKPLMVTRVNANMCYLNKPEWDTANTTAGTF
jgi:hypothetical protein